MINSIKRFFGITTETTAPVAVKTARAYDRKEEGFLFSFAFPEVAEDFYPAQFHAIYEIGEDISTADILAVFPNATDIVILGSLIKFTLNGNDVEISLNREATIRTKNGKTVKLRRRRGYDDDHYEFYDDDFEDLVFWFLILDGDDGYYESDITVSRDGIEFTSDEVSSMEDIEYMMASIEDQVELKETYEPDPIEVEDEVELSESYTSDPIVEDDSDITPDPEPAETVTESSVEVEDTSDYTEDSDTSY